MPYFDIWGLATRIFWVFRTSKMKNAWMHTRLKCHSTDARLPSSKISCTDGPTCLTPSLSPSRTHTHAFDTSCCQDSGTTLKKCYEVVCIYFLTCLGAIISGIPSGDSPVFRGSQQSDNLTRISRFLSLAPFSFSLQWMCHCWRKCTQSPFTVCSNGFGKITILPCFLVCPTRSNHFFTTIPLNFISTSASSRFLCPFSRGTIRVAIIQWDYKYS